MSPEAKALMFTSLKGKTKEELNAKIDEIQNYLSQAKPDEVGYLTRNIAYMKLKSGDVEGAEESFRSIAEGEVQADEAEFCDAKLRLAYLKLKKKKYEESAQAFLEIASGEFPTDTFSALDSSQRAATLFRLKKKPLDSIEISGKIAEQSPYENEAAFAKLRISGLYWELGKGDYPKALSPLEKRSNYFQKSMDVCEEIISAESSVHPAILCVAELINLEDYYFTGQYNKTVELAEEFTGKWQNYQNQNGVGNARGKTWCITHFPKRHILTAKMWLAMSYYRTASYDKCVDLCRDINSGIWAPKDSYRNFNVFAYAYLYEAMACESLGEIDEAKEARRSGNLNYPTWFDTIGLAEEARCQE